MPIDNSKPDKIVDEWKFRKGRSTYKYIGVYTTILLNYCKEKWPNLHIFVPSTGLLTSDLSRISFQLLPNIFILETADQNGKSIHIAENNEAIEIIMNFDDRAWSEDFTKLIRMVNNNNIREDPSLWFTTGDNSTKK